MPGGRSILFRCGDPGFYPFEDEIAFVFGEGGEHVQHEPPAGVSEKLFHAWLLDGDAAA